MKNIIILLIISAVLGCKKSNKIVPKNYLKIDNQTYYLNHGYYENSDPNGNFGMYLSNDNIEKLSGCYCEGQIISITLRPLNNKIENEQYAIKKGEGFVNTKNENLADIEIEIGQNGNSKSFSPNKGVLEFNGQKPNFLLKFNGQDLSGKKFEIQFEGLFKSI